MQGDEIPIATKIEPIVKRVKKTIAKLTTLGKVENTGKPLIVGDVDP